MTVSVRRLAGTAARVAAMMLPGTMKAAAAASSSSTSALPPQKTLPASVDTGQNIIPWVNDPLAKDPQVLCPGYNIANIQMVEGSMKMTADLDLAGKPCNLYGNDVEALKLTIENLANDMVHIEILPRYLAPENESWFELPEVLVPKVNASAWQGGTVEMGGLTVTWANESAAWFTVARSVTGDVLLSTQDSKLVYEDQFIEFVVPLVENYNLYGLGETMHGFRLGNNLTRTLYASDAADPVDGNMYGSHPMYLETRYYGEESRTHGVFLRNAHGQEVLLQQKSLTWRMLGGSVDLYVYGGPGAMEVLKAYQQTAVGLPAQQQYFAFGYHQCRWGYKSWNDLNDVVDNFAKANLPLETIWSDIDYMKNYRDFETDPVNFGYDDAAKFLDRLHAAGQHYVPIVDSAIYTPNPSNESDAYAPYGRGIDKKAFLLNPDNSVYVGAVWPGYTVFPDWAGSVLNGTGAIDWWKEELSSWHQKVAYDGIWIDMSEASSFCVGSCGSDHLEDNPVSPPFAMQGTPGNQVTDYPEGFGSTNASEAASASAVASSQAAASAVSSKSASSTSYLRTTPTPGERNINYPPYAINNIQGGDLAVHAISPNATHHGGMVEYDLHNLWGYQILNATYAALLAIKPGVRPFLIGRSTFAGAGRWAGHWGGDNYSKWSSMVLSIPQALSFSMFGVPMFGVDTCGFNGNTDEELCSRWMQLSAFFPFYRNHNTLGAISQEPYQWSAVTEASRIAMTIRYQLLPYFYTLFAHAHEDGSLVMRALAWEFPSETWLASADRQFMLGPALYVVPCLEQNASSVNAIFPGSGKGDNSTQWYDWYTQTVVDSRWTSEAGRNVTVPAELGHIPLFIRGGHVLALQEAAYTTILSRQTPWSVLAALDSSGKAVGDLYLDDGFSVDPTDKRWVSLNVGNGVLNATTSNGNYAASGVLGNVTVLGVTNRPSSVSFNDHVISISDYSTDWTYDRDKKLLQVKGLDALMNASAWGSDWHMMWQ